MSHLMSLSGAKRTCLFALQMSAFDPKRTLKFNFENKNGAALKPRQVCDAKTMNH
jgi:hypothetical protein